MDEHHEGEAPTAMSSAVRSRFWAGLNHASDHATEEQETAGGEAEPDVAGAAPHGSSAPRDQSP